MNAHFHKMFDGLGQRFVYSYMRITLGQIS